LTRASYRVIALTNEASVSANVGVLRLLTAPTGIPERAASGPEAPRSPRSSLGGAPPSPPRGFVGFVGDSRVLTLWRTAGQRNEAEPVALFSAPHLMY